MKEIYAGKRFGRLTCMEVFGRSVAGQDIWLCACDCGNRVYASESMLRTGVQRSCGCMPSRAKNLQGQVFGRLKALEPTEKRDLDGSVTWLCRCECGKLVTVSSNKLLTGHKKSCGCLADESLAASKTYVDGTCLEQIVSQKIPVNNSSGIKGVYRNRNQWCSYIAYAGKQYMLGRFSSIDDAAATRKIAEQMRIDHVKALKAGCDEPPFDQKIHKMLDEGRSRAYRRDH